MQAPHYTCTISIHACHRMPLFLIVFFNGPFNTIPFRSDYGAIEALSHPQISYELHSQKLFSLYQNQAHTIS